MALRTKLIIIVAIVLLASIGASTTIVLNLQKNRIFSSKATDIDVLGNIIMRGVERAMATGDTNQVQQTLETIGKSSEIRNLRILSNDGYILKSKNLDEIGRKSKDFVSNLSNAPYRPIISEDSIIQFYPVLNKPECFGCHSETIKINGIVEIKHDISRNTADILATRKFLILSNILTVMVVTGLVGVLFTRLVLSPLDSFKSTIRAVEAGDMDARVTVSGKDDLSEIGHSFNRMLDEVKSLYQRSLKKEKEISKVKVELDHKMLLEELNAQLHYKIKEVETANKAVLSLSKEVKSKNIELEKMVARLKRINEVGRMLSSIIDSEELLKIIIKTASDTLKVEQGSIHIMRDKTRTITINYHHEMGFEELSEGDSTRLNPLYNDLMHEGRSILLNEPARAASAVGASASMQTAPTLLSSSALGVPLKMKGQVIGGMLLERKLEGQAFSHDELELLDTMGNQALVALENAWLYETVKSNYFGTIQSLVNALEASDRYTKGHSERVRLLGVELAKYLGLDHRELELIEHAAILHDIGKIGIDTSVLNKEQALTHSEFSLIRAHPIIGDEILGPIGTLEGVRTTILQHHERYDGKGYPYGISGEEITLKARILAVIDTFDAMLTDRPYRKSLTLGHALEELRRGTGTQFDPTVVAAFLEMIKDREELLMEAGYSIKNS